MRPLIRPRDDVSRSRRTFLPILRRPRFVPLSPPASLGLALLAGSLPARGAVSIQLRHCHRCRPRAGAAARRHGVPLYRGFLRNLGGPANKQPYAAVIAGTAAAQSPSIVAGSIGSRSRSQQRTNWKIWTNGSRTLGQSAAILTEKSRANSAKSLANVSCHERGKKYLTWQNASNAEPPPGIDERHLPARGEPILVSAIYFADGTLATALSPVGREARADCQ